MPDLFVCCILGLLLQVAALKDINVGQVAAGMVHSMCLNLTGSQVYSWGREDYGQLGRGGKPKGSFTSTPTIVKFPALESPKVHLFTDIACGDHTSMALTADHDLYTWGYESTTGHQNQKDVSLPKKLDVNERLKKKKNGDTDSNGSTAVVYKIGSGSQHSALLVKRYANNSS
jgi:alpha-tubulin suppressor-like RCC1 family protein